MYKRPSAVGAEQTIIRYQRRVVNSPVALSCMRLSDTDVGLVIITLDSTPGQCFLREHQSPQPAGSRCRLGRRSSIAAAAGSASYG
jgi:hypothetical protein